MKTDLPRILQFYWRWIAESFDPAYRWARWVGGITLLLAPLNFYLEIAQRLYPPVTPLIAAVPGWVPQVAFAAFCLFFGCRLLWRPYAQVSRYEVVSSEREKKLLGLRHEVLQLIERCRSKDWLQQKQKLYEDMTAYFNRASEVAGDLGDLERMRIWSDFDIPKHRLETPPLLGGWVGANYPKLATSAIRIDEFIDALKASRAKV